MSINVAQVVIAGTDKSKAAFDSVNRSVDDMKGRFGSLAGLLGVGMFAGMMKESLESADHIGKMAQSYGVATESMSRNSVAAKLNDVDIDSLGKSMGKLNQNIMGAFDGTGKSTRAFDALDIKVKDVNGRMKNADEIMFEVADRFANMEDGAGKSALAVDLFGKSGAAMIPMLNKGSQELREMADLSDKLGLTLDSKTAEAANNVNDRFTIMGMATKGVSNNVMKGMLPTFDSLSKVMVDAATDTDLMKSAADGLSVMLKTLVSGGIVIKAVFSAVGNTIGGAAAAIMAAIHGDFKGAAAIMKDTGNSIVDNASTDIGRIATMWENNTPVVKAAAEKHAKTVMNGYGVATRDESKKIQDELYRAALAGLEQDLKVHDEASKRKLKLLDQELAARQVSEKDYDAQKSALAADRFAIEEKIMWSELQLAEKKEDLVKQAEIKGRLERNQLAALDARTEKTPYVLKALDAGMTPTEKEQQGYNAKLDLAKTFRDQSTENQKRYNEMVEQIEQEHQNKLVDLGIKGELSRTAFKEANFQTQAGIELGFMQQTIGASSQHSRAMFNIAKTAAIAQGLIALPKTVMKAYDWGNDAGGPWVGAAFAVLAGASQLIQLNAIRSAEYGGGGGGAAVGGGTSSIAIPGQTANPGVVGDVPTTGAQVGVAAKEIRQVNITLRGTDVFSAGNVRDQLIPLLNDALGDGVQLNVSAA